MEPRAFDVIMLNNISNRRTSWPKQERAYRRNAELHCVDSLAESNDMEKRSDEDNSRRFLLDHSRLNALYAALIAAAAVTTAAPNANQLLTGSPPIISVAIVAACSI